MTNDASRTYTVKALTDLWTGDAEGKPGRTITTGLLGSIRWWFEVLVRGLGGSACDPTRDGNRCPAPGKKPTDLGHHCVVCELFGCTGWARKFRFEVLDGNGQAKVEQITKGQTFRLRFTPLRPIRDEEWALLDLTLRLIAEYAAIGGKTVLKPSDEPNRTNKPHHRDYGLIEITEDLSPRQVAEHRLRHYVTENR
jgi:CRISPR-associated protein Cmr1